MALDRLDARELIKNATRLPTLPSVALEIVRVANDPKTAAEDLSRLLSVDQSLSAKVLRMVNSSYYGARQKVSSVKQAVVILGFETVRSLGVSAAIMDKFGLAEEVPGFSRVEFWKHSLGVAMTARVIARQRGMNRDAQETWYMAGLLHDIGKVLLDQHFHDHLILILERVRAQRVSFYQAEKALNDLAHDDIGGFLSHQWGLPAPIIAAVRLHHKPMEALADVDIVDGVHVANILTKTKGMGSGGDDDISGLVEESITRLKLSQEDVSAIIEVEMDREFDGAKEMLSLLG